MLVCIKGPCPLKVVIKLLTKFVLMHCAPSVTVFKPVSLFTLNLKKNPYFAEYLKVKHSSLRRCIFLDVYVGHFCASLPSFLLYLLPFLNISHQSLFLDGY